MGSAVIKQRAEQKCKNKTSPQSMNNMEGGSLKEKYAPLDRTEGDRPDSQCSSVTNNIRDKSLQGQDNVEASNRKKRHLGKRMRMLKFFTNSEDENTDNTSCISSDNSPNLANRVKSILLKPVNENNGLLQSPSESHENCFLNSHSEKEPSNIELTTQQHPNHDHVIKSVDMTHPDIDNSQSNEENASAKINENMDNEDTCRDARTPSPIFDDLENFTVMSFKEDSNTITNNLEKKTSSENQSNEKSEEQTKTATDQPQQPKDSETFESPTVNHPMVENVLASGDDYVDGLDEKFVKRGNTQPHNEAETNGEEEGTTKSDVAKCDDADSVEARMGETMSEQGSVSNSEYSRNDDVFGGQKNNSRISQYVDWSAPQGLSQERIDDIRRQVYQEGLAPLRSDGGVSFFVPVEENGMRPASVNAEYPPRLKVSRKSGLSYEERMFLADLNRSRELDKRKEFAARKKGKQVKFNFGSFHLNDKYNLDGF